MNKADILIRALEPEINLKCAEIRQQKSERLLSKIFIAISLLLLTVPVLLVFFGVSILSAFIPILLIGTVFLAASPFILSKGV